jgi:hypothetical protein
MQKLKRNKGILPNPNLMFYQFLKWFWSVNETTERVSGMPTCQFGDKS